MKKRLDFKNGYVEFSSGKIEDEYMDWIRNVCKKQILEVINNFERYKKHILTTDKIIKEKVLISEYFCWEELKKLKNEIKGI